MDPKQRQEFITEAEKLRETFISIANDLDRVNENVNIANVVGSCISIFGGVLAITGAVLTPFTFGAGAIVGIAGTSICTAGGVTTGGAKLIRYGKNKLNVNQFNTEWEQFKKKYNITNEVCQGDSSVLRDAIASATTPSTVSSLVGVIVKAARSIGEEAARLAGNAGRVVTIASSPLMFVNAILLPYNIYDLYAVSSDLYSGQGCEAGLVFRKVAEVLQQLINKANEL